VVVYRNMDREALDAAYNNSAAVADSDRYIADWLRRSEGLRARLPDHLDLVYGDAPRTRLDFFAANRSGGATLLFFHGGYWQRNTKEGLQRRRRRTARTWLPCCSRRLHTGARG
jgi:arylformamidase